MFNILFILSIIPWVFSTFEMKGKCPDVKTINNFDALAYTSGLWYQVARFQNDWEKKGDCVTLEFKHNNNGIQFNLTEFVDKTPNSYVGNIHIGKDAKQSVTVDWESSQFKEAEGSNDILTHILDSDNHSYCICYECRYDTKKDVSYVSVWVISRTKKLEGAAKTAVDNYFKTSKIVDASKLVWGHYNDKAC